MSDFILDVGHVICCCSAVSAADRQRLWKWIQLLIHSVGNVSALFVESCCYSAVVRVGGFLETSSRSVLRLQSWVHTKSNVSALFQATFRHVFKLRFGTFARFRRPLAVRGSAPGKLLDLAACKINSGKQAAGQKNCFYRLQRWHEGFCRAAFCLAWARILLLFGRFAWAPPRHFAWHESCCCSGVSHGLLYGILLGMGSNPAAFRAFRMGSFTAPRHVCGRFGLGTTFGSSTAFGVAVYWFRTQPRSEGAGHKKKCFMDSKGDGKHFFWLVFLACLSSAIVVFGFFGSVAHELHFCVCAGYRLLICYGPLPMFFFTASKLQFRHRVEGLWTHRFWLARARLVVAFGLFGSVASSFSAPASQRGCWPQEMFYGFQRWREAFFLACVFGLPELGLLWCLAFSDPLPTSFIFVSVQVIVCLSATVLYLCFFLRLRSCSFGTVWKGCERIVFGLPELGL